MVNAMGGPELDIIIDGMLTRRDSALGKDPLDPGEFPSLGFPNEKRGSYYLQVQQDGVMITVWRSGSGFDVTTYKRSVYNGVASFGSDGKRVHCDDLIQVQMAVHHILTPEGNEGDIT